MGITTINLLQRGDALSPIRLGFNPEDYDLSADGQTFVVVAPAAGEAEVLVAVNWSDELGRSLRGRE